MTETEEYHALIHKAQTTTSRFANVLPDERFITVHDLPMVMLLPEELLKHTLCVFMSGLGYSADQMNSALDLLEDKTS